MCTSLAFPERGLYGRNLDLEYHFGEQVVLTPRKFPFAFHHHPALAEHYALLGMASRAGGVPLYAEATNEKGLYMAGLNFPGNAHYFAAPKEGALNLAPYELFPLVLGQCATVAEARRLLEQVHLVAEPFGPGYPLAPLHWQIAGPDGVLVAEPMADGLHLYEDAWGVLTNNPPFPWQQMNLNQYRGLSPATPENRFAPARELEVFGQGLGGLGLPGDASPASRFVRAAVCKQNAVFPEDRAGQVVQFFHLLDAVAMVRGSVQTPEGRWDETIYSSCLDVQGPPVYYYKTCESGCLHAVRFTEEAAAGREPVCHKPVTEPGFAEHTLA